jgi:hypothetical protein
MKIHFQKIKFFILFMLLSASLQAKANKIDYEAVGMCIGMISVLFQLQGEEAYKNRTEISKKYYLVITKK